MPFFRTIAIACFTLLATVTLSSCALDKGTQATIAIKKFSALCPTQMKTQFATDATFSSLGDAFLTSLSNNTCSCIAGRLEKLPPEKVVQLDNDSASTKEAEVLVSPCAAIALRPHINDLCMAGVKQSGGDASLAAPRCRCVQNKVNQMDDATIEKTFSNIETGFTSVAEACMD